MKKNKRNILRLCILFFFVFFTVKVRAQQTTISDSTLYKKNIYTGYIGESPTTKLSVNNAALINVGIYGGSMIGLYAAWYKNYPQSSFHSFNDWAEWQQMDKIGHTYSAYTMGRFSLELWKQTNLDRKKKIWIGGLSGAAYQTVIEVLDGFSSQWGWSWGDMGANILGSGSLIAQELAWNEQRIQLKTSFHRKNYTDETLNHRSNDLFGKSLAERYLKDYNGQTYWISGTIKSFFPNSKIPSWLQLSIGVGAEGMFGARENIAKDINGDITFNRTDIPRIRQWYLAPDIDLTKIKTKKKGIKTVLFVLNSLKFPMPALSFSNSKLKWHWLYF
ncbi:MAG: DUF2279 domain-containing protein [Bacteroidota bacterium]